MIPFLQISLLLLAVLVWTLALECAFYFLYGLSTYVDGRIQRRSYKIAMVGATLLTLSAIALPWLVLILRGLTEAIVALVAMPAAVALLIFLLGLLIEAVPNVFVSHARGLAILRSLPAPKRKAFLHTVEKWPRLTEDERQRFLGRHRDLATHVRESQFAILLDDFPVTDSSRAQEKSLERHDSVTLRHWAGAALFNHLDPLLAVRHALDAENVFEGTLALREAVPDPHETEGTIRFARVGDNAFVIGRVA
jgi:hypothetical protein